MRGIEEVKQSQTLQSVMALTLAVGNEMNRSDVKCFDLNSLLKLSSIKGPSSPSYFIKSHIKILLQIPPVESPSFISW